ncbi:MAG: hypothetical protein AABW84_02260 [Nanoarchaeota archaeon]
MKRGQGLPLNTIILAILALLVLVFVVLFATGAFENLFGQTKTIAEATEADIVAAQTKCSQWCLQAQGSSTKLAWISSNFCTETPLLLADADDDGKDEAYHCYEKTGENPIAATCSTTVEEGEVDETMCRA